MIIPAIPPIRDGQRDDIPGVGRIVGGPDLRATSLWDEFKRSVGIALEENSGLVLFGPRTVGARNTEGGCSSGQLPIDYTDVDSAIDNIYCHGLEDSKVILWMHLALTHQMDKLPLMSWGSVDCDPGSRTRERIFLTSPAVNRYHHRAEFGIFQTFEIRNLPQICRSEGNRCNVPAPWMQLTLHLHIRLRAEDPQVVIAISSPIENGSIVKAETITKVIM